MKFETRKIQDCAGWSLAHSVSLSDRKLAKSTELTPEHVSALAAAGVEDLLVFKLEASDLEEDMAAKMVATQIAGAGLRVEEASRGRANLVAEADGVFLPGTAIDEANQLEDAFSAASLRPFTAVTRNQIAATVKVVPYGVPESALANLSQLTKAGVSTYRPFRAILVTTGEAASTKTVATTEARIEAVGGTLALHKPVPHQIEKLSADLKGLVDTDYDLILILGVSAISDARDVLPAALVSAGGHITKIGMPADPGNLLMVGSLGGKTVIGLPGCARSPALNGFDWVLERFAASLPLDHATLTGLGTGALLKEGSKRPVPRAAKRKDDSDLDGNDMAAIVLAAGRSSRAGAAHKLLSHIDGQTVLEKTLATVTSQRLSSTSVVTGFKSDAVTALLADYELKIVENKDFARGMGSSLAAGVASLDDATEFAVICLADMPFVRPETYKALCQAARFSDGPTIIIPTFHGKRGHPVIWHRRFFPELRQLSGDVGGRDIIRNHESRVRELAVDDPGILIDLDTPEMLKQFGVTPANR